MIITNKSGDIQLPYDPDLLEWLQITYPFSQYHILEL